MSSEITRYSDEDLEMFGKLIDEKLEVAKAQLEIYLKNISDHGENEDARFRGLDNSAVSVDHERMINLAGRQRKLIQHLQNARARVDNKVYGVCRELGTLISKKRLIAVPHATLSIKAKQKG